MPSRVWMFGSRGHRPRFAAIGLAGSLALLGGCASGGSGTASPERRSTPADTSSIEQQATPFMALGYSLTWALGDTQGDNSRIKMLDIGGDLILAHDRNNNLTAREIRNGEVRWATNLGNRLTKFVGNVRLGDRIVSASEAELLILDASTGRLDDRQRLGVLSNTAPVVANGYMLVFGAANGEVFGHDLRVGFKRWGFQLNERVRAEPVRVGQFVGAVAESGQVLLVNPLNGESVSRVGQIYGGMDTNPISDGRVMYVASADQSIYAFAGSTGELLWRVRTQSRLESQPAVHDGTLYVHVPDEGMLAVATRDGRRLWANRDISGEVIAVRRGNLLVWNGSEAMLVDPSTGDLRERVALPGVRQIIANGFVDGDLIVLRGNSALSRFISR